MRKALAWGLAIAVGSSIRSWAQSVTFDQGIPTSVLDPRPGLHLGRFDLHGGISTSFAYDDLVQINGNRPESDYTWSINPLITLRTEGPNSRKLSIFYEPSFVFYTEHTDLNSINHAGNFQLVFPFNRLTLSLGENVAVGTVVVRDIGNRATQASYSTTGTADYVLSDRTSFQGVVTYSRSDYGGQFISSQQWNEQLFADYHFSDKLSIGPGVSLTEYQIQGAPGQMSEGPLVRFSYRASKQLQLTASAGVVLQQFDSGASSGVAEVFSIAGSYQLRPGTSFTLQGNRSEQPSGLDAGQNFTSTTFSASINQSFPHRVVVNLTGGYTQADYYAIEPGVTTGRADNYYYVRSDVTYSFSTAWTLGFFVEHDANSSNGSPFNYDHNIAGVRAGWSF